MRAQRAVWAPKSWVPQTYVINQSDVTTRLLVHSPPQISRVRIPSSQVAHEVKHLKFWVSCVSPRPLSHPEELVGRGF